MFAADIHGILGIDSAGGKESKKSAEKKRTKVGVLSEKNTNSRTVILFILGLCGNWHFSACQEEE